MKHVPEQGINLIGYLGANLGQGVAARNTAQLLASHEVPFAGVNVKPTLLKANADTSWEASYWNRPGPAPFSANLFHMNPPEARAEIRMQPSWLAVDGRVNAIVPFWELSSFPSDWLDIMGMMDLVLAPTLFIQDTLSRELAGTRIIRFPQTVYVPESVRPDRDKWGFVQGEVVFVTSLDLNSDLARKNPVGAIEAFRGMRASLPATDAARARFIIKMNNASGTGPQVARLAEITKAIAGDPAISLVTTPMSYREVLSLYASCDVFVSLHRSEGLGLGLLEAMALGTPVIATGYSGNLDFMTSDDSCLVDYRLVPVSGTSIGSYASSRVGHEQVWAEPDVQDASRWMSALLTDESLRARLGAAARIAARATQQNPERTQAVEEVLSLALSPRETSPLRQLQSRPALYWRARNGAARVARPLKALLSRRG